MGEKTKEPKNIYAKMASVKSRLLGIKKGGKNEFSHYSYFELGDILPVLTPALEEEGLYMKTQFSATEQVAKLVIIDIDAPESQIDFEIKFAECALKGAHEIQNLGAAQTYTRRYLIMTAFDIAEADIVDAGAEQDEEKAAQKKNTTTPAPKTQQTAQQTNPAQQTPQEDITQLRRETWELIKRLPKEEQASWINSCKGADRAKLKQLINDLNVKQKTITQETAQDGPVRRERLANLKAEIHSLIEKLPEEEQNEWTDASADADESLLEYLLLKIKEHTSTPQKKSQGHVLADMASQETEAPQKPAEGSAGGLTAEQELEIF